MKPEQLAEALETAASQLGVKVRYETLTTTGPAGGGGLCRVKGEWFIIIDRKTAVLERVSILVEALASMDTEHLYLPPKVRDMLAQKRAATPKIGRAHV